jgi:predicted SAM-dependent methyltransferase
MPERKVINLGSGRLTSSDIIDVDCIAWPGVDVVCDITKGLPFGKEEIDEVFSDYVLCQISDRDKFKYVMNEVWRILKPGGLFKIKVPDARFPVAFNDPMDCRYFVNETFDYFNKDHYRFKAFNYGFKGWEIVLIRKERADRLYVEMRKP